MKEILIFPMFGYIFGYISIVIVFIATIDLGIKLSPTKRFIIQALSVITVIIFLFITPFDIIKFSKSPADIGNDNIMMGYSYIRNNTASDALIISWWDYGNDVAYLTQRRTVIDKMQIQNSDIINVSKIIMGTDSTENLQIAKNYKNRYNNSEVYLLIRKFDGMMASVIEYASGEGKNVLYDFDQTDHIEAMTSEASETNYYKLMANQTMEGYDLVYANKEMKIFRLNI